MQITVKSEADLLSAKNIPFKWNPELMAITKPVPGSSGGEYKGTIIFKEWEP